MMLKITSQLKSIHLNGSNAPVILVGTRKDEIEDGHSSLFTLSEALSAQLSRRCAPMIAGLMKNSNDNAPEREELCFYAIENSRGFKGDASIRALVDAIDNASKKLPSMAQLIPLPWLTFGFTRDNTEGPQRAILGARARDNIEAPQKDMFVFFFCSSFSLCFVFCICGSFANWFHPDYSLH